jgi:predicted Rossmann-fold nucleotide-binding protein
MPGNLGTSEEAAEMYWVAEHVELDAFKRAIGARTIWKYRLRFYTSLEEFIEAKYSGEDASGEVPEEDIMPDLPSHPDIRNPA